MSADQDPPDPERAGSKPGNFEAPQKQSTGAGRSGFQDTEPTPRSQSLASMDEGAEILGEDLPEYIHQDSNQWSDGWNYRDNPASPKQITCLRNFGIDATGASLGHASRLIGKLLRREKKGLASFDDVRWLHQHGVANARKLTGVEARRLIEIISYEQMETDAQQLEGSAECSP